MTRFLAVLVLVLVLVAAACHAGKPPELRVIGVRSALPHQVVMVEVTNSASHAMRLTKLEYTFAADGATVSEGELPLFRDVPAGATVVVEVPLDKSPEQAMTMRGELTAELDQIVRSFSVSADIQPPAPPPPAAP